jgi:hypothetical protein
MLYIFDAMIFDTYIMGIKKVQGKGKGCIVSAVGEKTPYKPKKITYQDIKKNRGDKGKNIFPRAVILIIKSSMLVIIYSTNDCFLPGRVLIPFARKYRRKPLLP